MNNVYGNVHFDEQIPKNTLYSKWLYQIVNNVLKLLNLRLIYTLVWFCIKPAGLQNKQ
jgi:hypothetical protein